MKKIIAMVVAAVLMVSATFALDLEFGARGILGMNLGLDQNLKDVKIEKDGTYDFGFGVYGNFALFGGLGIQAEANYIKSSVTFSGEKGGDTVEVPYVLHTLDVAPMLWLNLDLWKFTIGFGAGPNFSIVVPSLNDALSATKDQFVPGLIAGADFKFYLTDHLGLVLSGRYIMEFTKSTYTFDAAGQTFDSNVPKYDYNRKTIYGGLGLEFKLL